MTSPLYRQEPPSTPEPGTVVAGEDKRTNHADNLDIRIVKRLVLGESYMEIAAAEYLSSRTIRRLVRSLKERLGVLTLAGVCAEAARRGWLAVQDEVD